MQAFTFYSPTRVVFGEHTEGQVGGLITAAGASRVLVVYGGQSAVKSGLLDRITASLEGAGLAYDTLGGVQPNPVLSLARRGVEQALSFGADFLLAVGGGSVIDTAKAIADGAANPEDDLWDIWTGVKPLAHSLPVGCVLTIPAAGSECSNSAVLTNDETMVKRGLSTDLHRPVFAVMNPTLTLTLPRYQIACGVTDIMMHTLDRFFNPVTDNELTDEIACALLRTVIRCGRLALKEGGDLHAMSELMWAGTLSHNDLTGLGGIKDFAPHQLGHELSAKFNYAHGATLSAVWGSWARYCVDTDPTRFAQLGRMVWGISSDLGEKEAAAQTIEATCGYFRSIGMPICLPELCGASLDEDALAELALRCTFFGKRTIGAFRVLGYDDILAIYRMANG